MVTEPHRVFWAGACFLLGVAVWTVIALILTGTGLRMASWAYSKVGITIAALAPLTLWAVWTALQNSSNSDLTLAYIGATAQRFGLLGTVIGIVAATVRIGTSLETGAAQAVTGALPAVGQAMVSTAVGFVIAIGCDFCRYIERQACSGK